MIKKVLKFGGTSVGTIERIQHVANIIKGEVEAGNKIIAVVSAMAGKTNELVNFSKNIDDNFDKRELDVLLSSGEQVTCALLAGALLKLKIKAKRNLLPIQPGDVAKTSANIDESRRELNFNPKTSIDEGVPKFIEWYKQYYKIK